MNQTQGTEEGAPPEPQIDVHETCARIAALDRRTAEIEAELEQLKQERVPLESVLINALAEGRINELRTRVGGRTVYLHGEDKWRAKVDKRAFMDALKAAGFDQYVREDYSWQSIRGLVNAWVKDKADERQEDPLTLDPNEAIPANLAEVMEVRKEFQVRSRRT